MVSPDLLGASAGAGFGAALAILLSWSMVLVQLSAFICGLVAVGIAYFISKAVAKNSQANIIVLVLAGILVSTIFSSCISITKLCADTDNTLPAITFWLMGGLADIHTRHLVWLLPSLLLGATPLLLIRWKFNILSFGDEEAQALGIDVGLNRLLVICCATLLTSVSVAMCGMIGFVGLVIPHMARLIFGANHEIVLPASLLLGGIFLVLVDDMARCVFPVEVPLGILCSLIGAPFFLFLLVKGRSTWI
jgi:iron complex transport system permease protein